MRTSSLREWFDFLPPRAKKAPVYAGDWTDWWASGIAAFGPRENAALMEAQRRAALAEQRGADPAHCVAVRRRIFLAAEHTAGASSSANAPYEIAAQAGVAAKQNMIFEAAYAANDVLRESLQPDYVMHDSRFESFDPGWRTLVEGPQPPQTTHPLRPVVMPGKAPDWKKLLGDKFAQVIVETPANGLRSTWYEVGKFNKPESHGRWPDHPKWKRKLLKTAKRRPRIQRRCRAV